MKPDSDSETSVYEINEKISIPARLEIAESVTEEDKPGQDYIDITVNVISTNITGNGRQYTVEDLHLNSQRLNDSGGLIFAMGKHPKDGEEPDASDHVGIGMTLVENDILTSRARVYNTATHPDIVQNIKRRLVRDVSVEGFVRYYKKTCKEGKCWQRGIGLHILRATFVSSGADPAARIIDIFESIDRDYSREITMDKTENKPENKPETKTEGAVETSPPVNETKQEQGTSIEHPDEAAKQETGQDKPVVKPENKTEVHPSGTDAGAGTGTGASESKTASSAPEQDTPGKEKKEQTGSRTSTDTEENLRHVVQSIDQDFKTNVLSALATLEEIIAESRNPKEYTKSQIKNMLEYLKHNSGMVDEEIKDTFYQCVSKLSDGEYIKRALVHLSENPGMMDDAMHSIMKQLTGVSESKKVPDETKVAESGKVKVTGTGEGELAGKRIVESPASSLVKSTFTDEVRKHVR